MYIVQRVAVVSHLAGDTAPSSFLGNEPSNHIFGRVVCIPKAIIFIANKTTGSKKPAPTTQKCCERHASGMKIFGGRLDG